MRRALGLSEKGPGPLDDEEADQLWRRLSGRLDEARERDELRDNLGLAGHQIIVLIDGLGVERVRVPLESHRSANCRCSTSCWEISRCRGRSRPVPGQRRPAA